MYRKATLPILMAATIVAAWALWYRKTPQQRSNPTAVSKAGDQSNEVVLWHSRSRSRSGLLVRVVRADEKPIQSGTVYLGTHENCTGVIVGERSLGPQGHVGFQGLDPDRGYYLSVKSASGETAYATLTPLPAGRTREVTLWVGVEWGIHGRVVDKQGTVVPRCSLIVRMPGEGRFSSDHTDANGRFSISSLSRGTGRLELTHGATDRALVASASFTLDGPGSLDLGDVVVGEQGRVEGIVLGHDDGPVGNASVWVIRQPNDRFQPVFTRTNSQGRFIVEGLGEGTITVGASPNDGGGTYERPPTVTVSDHQGVEIRLKKREPKATLRVYAKSTPVPGASPRAAIFDTSGNVQMVWIGSWPEFTVRNLEFGKPYWVHVSVGSRWGRSGWVVPVQARNDVEVIVDREGCEISGTLV